MTRDALEWLFARQRFGVRPGLDRIREILRLLGAPHEGFQSVLVAGTNGKGSATAALAAALATSGGRNAPVARFVSPHLERLTERFVIDGREATPEAVAAALDAVREPVERCDGTFFEAATAAAAVLFREARVQTVVWEVGLGGRFDATNAFEPVHSIITGIALDHVDVLGSDPEVIAAEKAGILREGVPAATGATGAPLRVIEREAAGLRAQLWRVGREIAAHGASLGWRGQRVEVDTPAGAVAFETPMLGRHQVRNLAVAVAAAQRMGVPGRTVEDALGSLRWPGRLEPFAVEDRRVVLDGAHNPAAARAVVAAMAELGVSSYTLVVGVGADKDVDGVVRTLAANAEAVVTTQARNSPRASAAAALAARLPGARAVPDPADALAEAVRVTPPEGTVLVAGSLYLVGEMRALMRGDAPEPFQRLQ